MKQTPWPSGGNACCTFSSTGIHLPLHPGLHIVSLPWTPLSTMFQPHPTPSQVTHQPPRHISLLFSLHPTKIASNSILTAITNSVTESQNTLFMFHPCPYATQVHAPTHSHLCPSPQPQIDQIQSKLHPQGLTWKHREGQEAEDRPEDRNLCSPTSRLLNGSYVNLPADFTGPDSIMTVQSCDDAYR